MLGEWPVAVAAPEPPVSTPPPVLPPVSEPDPWTIQELPVAPLGGIEDEPEPVVHTEAVLDRYEPEREPELEPVAQAEPELEVELARSVQGVARYSLDPLADPAPRKRFGRGGSVEIPAVEVPSRPEGLRPLPGRSSRQD
jgi:hypothetical protein